MRMIQRESRLAAQVGLKISHEKRSGNSLSRDVTDDQAEHRVPASGLTEIEEIEVITADLASLQAQARVLEGLRLGMDLRKQAGLDLLGDFQFLGSTTFGFELLSEGLALLFDTQCQLVKAGESEPVPVDIFEAGMESAPGRNLRWEVESNAAAAPFLKFGIDVFREKLNAGVAADQFECIGVGCSEGEGDVCAAVRRRDFDPAAARLECVIDNDAEAKLVHVETHAALLIADENHNEVQREIGLLTVEAQQRPVNPKRQGSVFHPRDYKVARASGHLAFSGNAGMG